jgi:CHAT domain-containing protein
LAAFAELPNQLLTGREATKVDVTSYLGKATHFVYFGHGGWDSRKSRGGLFLAQDPDNPANDGELTDTEIRKMKLTQTRLAVLAACETGFIDIIRLPDEFSGLIESLLQAGCSTVVASLWPVAADITWATTERMLLRHIRGSDNGQRESPAQALRRVQLALRDAAQPTYGERVQAARPASLVSPVPIGNPLTSSQPVFWAAFTCVGA